jgi:hypothetical protein
MIDEGLFHLGCLEVYAVPKELDKAFLNELDQRVQHFLKDLTEIKAIAKPEQEPVVGSLLFKIIDSAKGLLEQIKEQLRQQAIKKHPGPGTVKIGSRCHVTIPAPQFKVRSGVSEDQIILSIGEERYRKLFERRERVQLVLTGDPTLEESSLLTPFLDRVEHTPRVSFKK